MSIKATNRRSGVSAERRHFPGEMFAAFCRDAATEQRFMGSLHGFRTAHSDHEPLRVADPPSASTLQRFNVSSRCAFTLTELLVVLVVLGFLAVTLLPALAATKHNSKLIQCQSNLRQIGAACAMYANDFNGWYPITSVGAANSYPSSVNHILGIHYTRYVYTPYPGGPGIVMPQTLQPGQDQNLGYLYADGLVTDGHVFYCPGFDVANTNAPLYPLSANYYSNPQFMSTAGPPGNDSFIRSSYMFNPRLVNAYNYPASSDILRRYQKTSDVKSRDVFTIDFLAQAGGVPPLGSSSWPPAVPFTPDNWAHWPGKGLNVLFTDGSAKFGEFNSYYFNAIVKYLDSGEDKTSAIIYDQIFNALRDSP